MSRTVPTIQGGLLVTGRTNVEDVQPGHLWHPNRTMWPHRIVAVRNVRGGRRITDEHGSSRTYRYGQQVPTATLVGGDWPGEVA